MDENECLWRHFPLMKTVRPSAFNASDFGKEQNASACDK